MITKCTGSPRAAAGMMAVTGKDADGILLDARDPARQHRATVPGRPGRPGQPVQLEQQGQPAQWARPVRLARLA